MRRWTWGAAALATAMVGAGAMLWGFGRESAAETAYRLAVVDRGAIVAMVRATGTLNPVTTVLVGSQLSGQIVEILADYNSPVKRGQVVARLFAEQIRSRRDAAAADLAQGKADLAQRRAQLDRAKATRQRSQAALRDLLAQRDRVSAQLADAKRTSERQSELYSRGSGSQTTAETARTNFDIQTATLASTEAQIASAQAELVGQEADIALADAQVQSAEAQILSRQAKLKDIEIDLDRTDIRSPVDGVVVQRQIDLGQTVAASLNAPTLFTVAQDLKEIDIYANVDESDVGRIKPDQVVTFTVNAYPNRTYDGRVKLVRLGAQTISNVVTYTAVINVDNRDLTLLPGMTANLQIVTDERRDVLRVANAALRFRPPGAMPATPAATGEGGGREGGGREGGGFTPEAMRQKIVGELEPTREEVAAIDVIIAEARGSRPGRDASMSPEERRAAFQEARRALTGRIGAALDPARRARFEEMVQEARAERRQAAANRGTPGRVYVPDGDGKPRPVALRLGISDGMSTEVLGGELAEGTGVITGGGPKPPPEAAPQRPGPRGPRLF